MTYCLSRISGLCLILMLHYSGYAQRINNDTLDISITAINLSEDMSTLSSKDDEILLLIYEDTGNEILTAPLLFSTMKLDRDHPGNQLSLAVDAQKKLLLIMLEQDNMTPVEQLDPIFRIHYRTIASALESNNRTLLETFLGDEDLLGMEPITLPVRKTRLIKFRGVYKMDHFEYEIKIDAR